MAFSFENIKDFDSHIEKSIPGYAWIADWALRISDFYVKERYYDIGCSTGKLVDKIQHRHPEVECFGIDKINFGSSDLIYEADATQSEYHPFEYATILFTLQFLSDDERVKLMEMLWDELKSGGAIVVAEKTYEEDPTLGSILHQIHYDFKRLSFDNEQIIQKEKQLRGHMRCWTRQRTEQMFNQIGFKCDVIWKNLNFTAWILRKETTVSGC